MGKRHGAQAATKGEWIAAALGAAVTLATIGFLAREALVDPRRGIPDLSVAVDSVIERRHGWAVGIEARNAGTATAAAVRIVGELRSDSGVVETSETTLDYVPEASSRAGALLFTRNPADYVLDVRPTGYARP